MTKLLAITVSSFLLVACAAHAEEEDEASTTSAMKCPSPTKDREGFIACMKKETSASESREDRRTGDTSGPTSGTVGSKRCSSLSIRCDGSGSCTCRGNGGPEKACNGSDCDEICCP